MKSIKVIVIGFILAMALVAWPVEYAVTAPQEVTWVILQTPPQTY